MKFEELKEEAVENIGNTLLPGTPKKVWKAGADWGFEQGVLHERKRAEGLAAALIAFIHCPNIHDIGLNFNMLSKALDQYLKSGGE